MHNTWYLYNYIGICSYPCSSIKFSTCFLFSIHSTASLFHYFETLLICTIVCVAVSIFSWTWSRWSHWCWRSLCHLYEGHFHLLSSPLSSLPLLPCNLASCQWMLFCSAMLLLCLLRGNCCADYAVCRETELQTCTLLWFPSLGKQKKQLRAWKVFRHKNHWDGVACWCLLGCRSFHMHVVCNASEDSRTITPAQQLSPVSTNN